MSFLCCILFCVATVTLVGCNSQDEFCAAVKSIVNKTYSPTSVLYECQLISSQNIEQIKQLKSQLMKSSQIIFQSQYVYTNKKYLISRFAQRNAYEAAAICTDLGGYLAEIDDYDEYNAIKTFVLNSPIQGFVLIGGTDIKNEGTWIFQRTRQPVQVLDWFSGQPDNANNEDCLSMWKQRQDVRMNDIRCGVESSDVLFMCELPNNI